MAVIGVLLAGILIAIREAPYLYKKRMFKELSFFVVILITGITLSMMQVNRIPIPNPMDWIAAIHKPIRDAVFGMLE